MVSLGNDWDALLGEEFKKDYYLALREFLKSEYFSRRIYPPMNDIFNALKYTSYENTRVVILGQDPYHGYGQAHGLCFSVKEGTTPPPSLKNIFKELHAELKIDEPKTGELIGDTCSCMMCKRLVINAGIETVIVRTGSDTYNVIDVQSWIDYDDSLSGKFGY